MNVERNNALRKPRLIGIGMTAHATNEWGPRAHLRGDGIQATLDLESAKRLQKFLDLFICIAELEEGEE